MRVVRENSPLKCVLIPMGDSLCAKLLVLNGVGNSYSPWHDCPSLVSFLASTNVRTICVVTIRIDMANMVAIATLIDIWEQKGIAETLLDRDKHQISEFSKKEFCFYLWETSFCYLQSLMWWLYLGMSVRPQCILPYRCRCGSRQCWYNSQSRHKHGFYWGTHRYLVVQII